MGYKFHKIRNSLLDHKNFLLTILIIQNYFVKIKIGTIHEIYSLKLHLLF